MGGGCRWGQCCSTALENKEEQEVMVEDVVYRTIKGFVTVSAVDRASPKGCLNQIAGSSPSVSGWQSGDGSAIRIRLNTFAWVQNAD